MAGFTRRFFANSLALGAAAALSGCATSGPFSMGQPAPKPEPGPRRFTGPLARSDYDMVYAAITTDKYPIAAFDYRLIDPVFLRQEVDYPGDESPGTIVVDPGARFLYRVEDGGRATRYGVGVGREGFGWSGRAKINMKREWADWVPPAAMIKRDPRIRAQLVSTPRGPGVPGGVRNPLGARTMYLFNEQGDTQYRIHGTLEPDTIGMRVSSGCIRLINQDAIDLYNRTPLGTKVLVLDDVAAPALEPDMEPEGA